MQALATVFLILLILVACIAVACAGVDEVEYKKLRMLKPQARIKIQELLDMARKKWPKYKIVLAETYRSQERQNELYAKGSHVTTVKTSMHTRGLAADIYFTNGQKILKYEEAPYLELGRMAESLGFTWGGRWRVPFDPGHFELRKGVDYADINSGKDMPATKMAHR